MSDAITLIIALMLILLLLILSWIWWSMMTTAWRSAPFVSSRPIDAAIMLELAKIQPGERVVDLGSGNGTVALAFAKAGMQVEGFEIQRWLVWWSRWRARWAGVQDLAHFTQADLWQVDCRTYNVVVLYIMPEMMMRMGAKLKSELPPGARVISKTFTLPGWKPKEVRDGIYVYQV